MARKKISVEYKFKIEAFSPDTIPMARLAEYMADLAKMLGQEEHVHFVKLEAGSTNLVHKVEWEAVPKVRERVRAIKHGEAPPDAAKAYQSIDRRLAQDNAVGSLIDSISEKKVVEFPGRKRPEPVTYGPFTQPGTLDGILIRIGGEDDPVPVHLEDGDKIHICYAKRSIARVLAPHLFGSPLRVSGTGKWRREPDGSWLMDRFTIQDFTELNDAPLSEVVNKLRRVEADWKSQEDPLGELDRLRRGPNQFN